MSDESICTIGIASKLTPGHEFVANNQLKSDGLVWTLFLKLEGELWR